MREANFEVAFRLLNEGVDINGFYFDEFGTFLYKAISETRLLIVDILLENGASPNILYNGENAFSFLRHTSRRDVLILKLLLEAGVWLLPVNYDEQTIVEQLDDAEYDLEQSLQITEAEFERYLESSNVNEEKSDEYQERIIQLNRELDAVREMISILRPIWEANVVKLAIEVSGTSTLITMPIDLRASVKVLKDILSQFYFEDAVMFELLYPAFHMKNKQVMNSDRALSDYGLRNGSKLVVVPQISSERHWNANIQEPLEGGKTRSRKKTRKSKKAKLNRKTRRT